MIKKKIQILFAKFINSKIVLGNPYINYELIENRLNMIKITRCKNQVIIGENSKFYEQAEVFNIQNDKKKIVIGTNSHIRGILLVFGYAGKISIGNDCYIGLGTQIWSSNEISIGNSVLISHNCNIIDNNSHEEDYVERHNSFVDLIKNGHSKSTKNIKSAPIVIEDNVWISFNVTILKGVTIGKGAIIGAGSIVTKNVEPFSVVIGNPAVKVKELR